MATQKAKAKRRGRRQQTSAPAASGAEIPANPPATGPTLAEFLCSVLQDAEAILAELEPAVNPHCPLDQGHLRAVLHAPRNRTIRDRLGRRTYHEDVTAEPSDYWQVYFLLEGWLAAYPHLRRPLTWFAEATGGFVNALPFLATRLRGGEGVWPEVVQEWTNLVSALREAVQRAAPPSPVRALREAAGQKAPAPPAPVGDPAGRPEGGGDADARSAAGSEPRYAHSVDFRSVWWDGENFSFTPNQAACVRMWWEAMENGTPDVGDAAILEAAGCETKRLRHVFRGRPAWGTLIVGGASKGTHRLAPKKM